MVNYVAFNIGIILTGIGSILILVAIVILNSQISRLKNAVVVSNGTPTESTQLKGFLESLEKTLRLREYALVACLLGFLLILGGLLVAQSSMAPTA